MLVRAVALAPCGQAALRARRGGRRPRARGRPHPGGRRAYRRRGRDAVPLVGRTRDGDGGAARATDGPVRRTKPGRPCSAAPGDDVRSEVLPAPRRRRHRAGRTSWSIDQPFEVTFGLQQRKDSGLVASSPLELAADETVELEVVLLHDPTSIEVNGSPRATSPSPTLQPYPTVTLTCTARYGEELAPERRLGLQLLRDGQVVGGRLAHDRRRRQPGPGRRRRSCRSGARSGCSTSTRCSATSRPTWSSRSAAPTPARRRSCGRRTPPTLPSRSRPAEHDHARRERRASSRPRSGGRSSSPAVRPRTTSPWPGARCRSAAPCRRGSRRRSAASSRPGPDDGASGPAAHRGAGGAVGARLPSTRELKTSVGWVVAVPGRPRGGLAVAARRAQAATPPARRGRRPDGRGPDRRLHRRPWLEEPRERRRRGRRGRGPLHPAGAEGGARAGHRDRPVQQPARVRRRCTPRCTASTTRRAARRASCC